MTDDPIFQSDNGEPEAAPAPASDRFADAIALCNLVANVKVIKARVRELAKVDRQIREAEAKLASVKAQAAELVAKAQTEVKEIHEAAAQRLETAESVEGELAQREQRITRLENYWRGLGEGPDVWSGLRSPEFSPLQKARMAAGREPGKDPDPLFLSEPDAAPAAAIDALIHRDVGDETSDSQGNRFAPSTLRRDLSHKQPGAE